MARTPLIAGNWKMNGLAAQLSEIGTVGEAVAAGRTAGADLILCVPATILAAASAKAAPGLRIGAQDCHAKASGAHTGDLSAEMLADAGASAVIVGHSERRTDHRESDEIVRAKLGAVHRAKLHAVVCIGETQGERDAGRTLEILGAQLAGSLADECTPENTTVAYEPVWAIGTGRTPTVADVAEVHDFLRAELAKHFGAEAAEGFRLLYGGSVKPDNAAELMVVANVDGALVGGASLKASDFLGIVEGAVAAKGRSGGLE